MLSICIPVYNFLISSLIQDLMNQCRFQSLTFEILVYDDGSDDYFKSGNQNIKNYKEVVYKELEKNIGCAGIRNMMANEAIYDNLLFIDSDSEINKEYIKNYIPFFNKDYSIVCGGRVHPKALPDLSKSLRWKVGKFKEDFPAEIRNKVPNKSFMSNNFLIQKKVFNNISFDEKISKSGHEDTLFGINLEIQGVKINHIDNQIVHLGLENNEHFIRKTKQRMDTLHHLEKAYVNNPLLYKRIKVLNVFQKLRAAGFTYILADLYQRHHVRIERKLCKQNPSLILYDLYKLGYYASITNR